MAGLRVRDFDAESVLQIREEWRDVDLEADCIISMFQMFRENETKRKRPPRRGLEQFPPVIEKMRRTRIISMSRMFRENENSPREGQGDVIGNTSPLHGVLYRLGRGRVDTG